MAQKRLSMPKVREILRLRLGEGRSLRQTARSVGCGPATVFDCAARAKVAGLSWPLDPDLDEEALEALLYPPSEKSQRERVQPDWAQVHREMRRKGVTLQLLWHEYKEAHPEDGYHYSQFCDLYRAYRSRLDVVMRQDHRAGEKMFVDFSGDGIPITNRETGEVWEGQLFVAVLGASSYTYVEVVPSQKLRYWIDAHIHAYEFFGGVAALTIPDNTRTAVTHACFYEPDINRTYLDLARHYDTAIVPTRPRKPRDKAKVESGVLVAQRSIVGPLRKHTFFNVSQANEAAWQELAKLNSRKFQKLDTSRTELFETLEKPALRPLPKCRYDYAEWGRPRVNIDYHVEVDKHYYSVPYQLVREYVDTRVTSKIVEIFFKGRRVVSHTRSYLKHKHTTIREHMPESHQRYLEWSPSRILNWAEKSGPATAKVAAAILEARPHPELGYRSCLGLMRLGEEYGRDRLEAASRRALAAGACSYKCVKSILKTGLDKLPLEPEEARKIVIPIRHTNIRGPDEYQ